MDTVLNYIDQSVYQYGFCFYTSHKWICDMNYNSYIEADKASIKYWKTHQTKLISVGRLWPQPMKEYIISQKLRPVVHICSDLN